MDSPKEFSLEEIIGNIVGGVEIPPIGKQTSFPYVFSYMVGSTSDCYRFSDYCFYLNTISETVYKHS